MPNFGTSWYLKGKRLTSGRSPPYPKRVARCIYDSLFVQSVSVCIVYLIFVLLFSVLIEL